MRALPFILICASVIVTALATLPFYTYNLRVGWLLSVVITEYGHWLAVVTLLLMTVAVFTPGPARLAVPALLAGLTVFALPAVQLIIGAPAWRDQLRATFGPADQTREPSLTRLFFGKFSRDVVAFRTMTYAPNLTLAYYPPAADHRAPWVMVVHGGGWDSGDATQLPELNSYLAARGIGVVSINYRLAPEHVWPAARDDVRAAARFVKAHAAELNLDPERWVILGRSAGGQLAQMVAFDHRDPGLRGCVSLYAPSDMNNAYAWGLEDDILASRPLVRAYMGGPPDALADAYLGASALPNVTTRAPPTLLLHGARDPLVWVRHSELLVDRLHAANVAATLITVPWGTHGFDYNLDGPGGQTLTLALDHFLGRVFH